MICQNLFPQNYTNRIQTSVCFLNFYFYSFFATGHTMGELSSSTKDRTHAPTVEARSLNHRTTREAPDLSVLRTEWEVGNYRWKRDRGKAMEKLSSSRWERELRPGPTQSQVILSLDLLSKEEIRLEHVLEKAMAPHSSTLAWKIPWMEEPGRLQCMGSRRVGHDWVTSLSVPSLAIFPMQQADIPRRHKDWVKTKISWLVRMYHFSKNCD